MTKKTKAALKDYFSTGDVPTESQFSDLIDKASPVNGIVIAAHDANAETKDVADYVCDGTADDVQIQAALDSLTSGGTIQLSEGSFHLAAGLVIGRYIIFRGSGFGTQVDATALVSTHAITMTGLLNQYIFSHISDLRITLPTVDSGDGIYTTTQTCMGLTIKRVYIDGGSISGWGITFEGNCNGLIESCNIRTYGNGIRITNDGSVIYNVGNMVLMDNSIWLRTANTIGYKTIGHAAPGATNNMITFIRCEAMTIGTPAGCTGHYLGDYIQKVILIDCDAEVMNLGYQLGTGANSKYITCINCYAHDCDADLAVNYNAAYPFIIIGGNGDFLDYETYHHRQVPIIYPTIDRTLSTLESHKVMNTDNVTGTSTTLDLQLPAADANNGQRYTIVNTRANVDAITIKFTCGAGDNILNQDGSVASTLTSGGAFGDGITLQCLNYKYWRVEDKTGTWT